MDPQSLLFVLLVIAIGGFSAYLADILGYKIGKKRLSIKRIRPKYVARISVVIAGMLIPIFTMIILYSVSSVFRTWVTKGSQIVRETEQAQRDFVKVNNQLIETEKTKANLENLKAITDDQLKKNDVELRQQKKTLTDLKNSVSEAKAKVDSANRDREKAQGELQRAQASLAPIQAKLDAKQKEYETADAKFRGAETNYKDAVKRYGETNAKNLELINQNSELLKTNKDIQKTSDKLQDMIVQLNKDIELLKSQRTEADAGTRAANINLAETTKQLEGIRTQLANEKADALGFEAFSRTRPISFGRGEEIARVDVQPQVSKVDAANLYRILLRRAKSVSSDRGAKPNSLYPFTGTAGSILMDKTNSQLTEDEVEAYYVNEIRKSKEEQVLVVAASLNRFVGEPVTLSFDLYPNPIVFHKGEIVTESRTDGRLSEIEILNGIREFLRTYVNTRARLRKMIPVQSRDGESYGEFTQDQLLSAVAKVKAVTRSARLVAVAKQDIRAGDSLDIDIEVR